MPIISVKENENDRLKKNAKRKKTTKKPPPNKDRKEQGGRSYSERVKPK